MKIRGRWKEFPYANKVGSIMCTMVCRPDVGHAISLVSTFMSNPIIAHYEALKWILGYLKRTYNLDLKFSISK